MDDRDQLLEDDNDDQVQIMTNGAMVSFRRTVPFQIKNSYTADIIYIIF